MPGWVGSQRRAALPANWTTEIAPRILKRDQHRCQHIRSDTGLKCRRIATDVDHIVPYSQGGTDADSNLQALCSWHHGKKSGREGGLASGNAKRARAQAEKPVHPGLLTAAPDRTPPPF